MSEEWKSAVLNHAILQTITPLPDNSFEQQSYFKSDDYIRVFPHYNHSECKSCKNDPQHLQSTWKRSELTCFGGPQRLEIERGCFSAGVGFQRVILENCLSLAGGRGGGKFLAVLPGCPSDVLKVKPFQSRKRPSLPDGLLCPNLSISPFSPVLGFYKHGFYYDRKWQQSLCDLLATARVHLCTTLRCWGWWPGGWREQEEPGRRVEVSKVTQCSQVQVK